MSAENICSDNTHLKCIVFSIIQRSNDEAGVKISHFQTTRYSLLQVWIDRFTAPLLGIERLFGMVSSTISRILVRNLYQIRGVKTSIVKKQAV